MAMQLPVEDLDSVLSLTPEFWSRYAGARLFMTGGTGFIGNWLLQVLQRANDQLMCRIEVVVLSRDADRARWAAPQLFSRPDTLLVSGNVTEFTAPVGKFDICVHAATDVGDPRKAGNALNLFDCVLLGTRRMLDLADANDCRRFLQMSSGAVYGVQPPALRGIPEAFSGAPDPLQRGLAYGNAKRAAEAMACSYLEQAARSDFQLGIARIFALIGPGMPLDGPFAAGNFVRDAVAGNPIRITGDGRPIRSYLYMADLCVWLLRILIAGKPGQAYNVGSEHEISIASLAEQVSLAAGFDIAKTDPAPCEPDVLPPRYVPDTSKARHELGLSEYTPLSAALPKTLQWARAACQS